MYLKAVRIKDFKAIKSLEMNFAEGKEAGWHVVLGDNGSGKTTLIRAIVQALIDRSELAHAGNQLENPYFTFNINKFKLYPQSNVAIDVISNQSMDPMFKSIDFEREFYSAFGSSRRFDGPMQNEELQGYAKERLFPALQAGYQYTGVIAWLQLHHTKRLEGNKDSERLLASLLQFINQSRLLPNRVQITKVSSDGVFATDQNGVEYNIVNLSDGYMSVLCIAFELLRQLVDFCGIDQVFGVDTTVVICPGLVLIDEIDAHLHPMWQAKIGEWFTDHFPKIQFIVTTHSPLICRAASTGSIWRLLGVSNSISIAEITGLDRDRLLYGNILDAYSTDPFEAVELRSEEGEAKLTELAKLNIRQLSRPLTDQELDKQRSLSQIFASDVAVDL